MNFALATLLGYSVATSALTQTLAGTPRFEDYPVTQVFSGKPLRPVLETPGQLKFQEVIRDGVSKGWGVYDGLTGKEMREPGPNFAGRYVLVSFGCGNRDFSACFMAAIVDAKTGRVFPPPSLGLGRLRMPYFAVNADRPSHYPPRSFHHAHIHSPLEYRLNSRLLFARICDGMESRGGSDISLKSTGCGPHYYLMDENGLRLIHTAGN